MKKVLWVSRHVMTKTQKKDLESRLEDSVNITQIDRTILDIEEIEKEIHGYDLLAVVLPVQLLADLKKVAGNIPVVVSVSERKKQETGIECGKYQFEHLYWQEIVDLKLETRKFHISGGKSNGQEER